MSLACVLVSDVTGSTRLYEALGSGPALARIDAVLMRMRVLIEAAGGHCVKARGDDILSFFDHPDRAFQAAWAMINEPWPDNLAIHAGGYFGDILSHADDIYGNAVNTAARLAGLAKPGEILFGDHCHDDLSAENRARFVAVGALPLRGKEAPTAVFSCSVTSLAAQTVVSGGAQDTVAVLAAISLGTRHWQLVEGGRLSIGRAEDCDIVAAHPSVSRDHGSLAIRSGQLEYSDHSTVGSVVRMGDGPDMAVHRRRTLLSGNGAIRLGAPGEDLTELSFTLGRLDGR